MIGFITHKSEWVDFVPIDDPVDFIFDQEIPINHDPFRMG